MMEESHSLSLSRSLARSLLFPFCIHDIVHLFVYVRVTASCTFMLNTEQNALQARLQICWTES